MEPLILCLIFALSSGLFIAYYLDTVSPLQTGGFVTALLATAFSVMLWPLSVSLGGAWGGALIGVCSGYFYLGIAAILKG